MPLGAARKSSERSGAGVDGGSLKAAKLVCCPALIQINFPSASEPQQDLNTHAATVKTAHEGIMRGQFIGS